MSKQKTTFIMLNHLRRPASVGAEHYLTQSHRLRHGASKRLHPAVRRHNQLGRFIDLLHTLPRHLANKLNSLRQPRPFNHALIRKELSTLTDNNKVSFMVPPGHFLPSRDKHIHAFVVLHRTGIEDSM